MRPVRFRSHPRQSLQSSFRPVQPGRMFQLKQTIHRYPGHNRLNLFPSGRTRPYIPSAWTAHSLLTADGDVTGHPDQSPPVRGGMRGCASHAGVDSCREGKELGPWLAVAGEGTAEACRGGFLPGRERTGPLAGCCRRRHSRSMPGWVPAGKGKNWAPAGCCRRRHIRSMPGWVPSSAAASLLNRPNQVRYSSP